MPAERTTAVLIVDLEALADRIDPGPGGDGRPHDDALVLVRRHGDPVALVRVPLMGGAAAAAAVAEHPEVVAGRARHAERAGCGDRDGAPCPARAPEAEDGPLVSVVIPTAGRPDDLERTLAAFARVPGERVEIIVVDNRPGGEVAGAVARAARADPRLRYLSEPRPGSSMARNAGLAAARGEIVAFTDDDVVVDPAWLAELVAPFARDPEIGATTGMVLPRLLEVRAERWFEAYGGFGKRLEERVFDLGEHRPSGIFAYPYWGAALGAGVSTALRADVARALGGFDPALGTGTPARGGADIEILTRVVLAGWRVAYAPRAILRHSHRRTERALRRVMVAYGAGFTAVLTRLALRDPLRVGAAVARSLVERRRPGAVPPPPPVIDDPFPASLRRLERASYLLGPPLALRSLLWARRLGLDSARPGPAPGGMPPARRE